MGDDIEVPHPDGYVSDESLPGAPLRPAYLTRTVRQLILAERERCIAICRTKHAMGYVSGNREVQRWMDIAYDAVQSAIEDIKAGKQPEEYR